MRFLLIIILSITIFSCGGTENKTNNNIEEKIPLTEMDKEQLFKELNVLKSNLFDTVELKTNIEVAQQLLEGSKIYISKFSNEENIKDVTYRAVQASEALGKNEEAVTHLNMLIRNHPSDSSVVDWMFERAFIYDAKLNNKELAKKYYQEVVNNFPEHDFGVNAKARLQNIDMTDEELIEQFIKNNANQE